ncbi:Nuclear transcription factor Y subunit A-9 [Sesamum alatum]|uniref:Nuclear transcription factor Y subunit n=1 Tax=Sesamum alatum TaxID=300844 RepID=A0AAE1YEK0_9LAMI|nr:Nuclear transcription factor Y subunit A-9 [Sesamum alatum]
MPALAKSNGQQLETGLRSIPNSTSYGQPWWQGLGHNGLPSGGQQEDGPISPATLQPQGTGEGASKDTETNATLRSGLNGSNNGQEQQQLDANSQMELVGHSIMLTPYPYADPQYGGRLTYGAPVHHLLGYHPARMPLPLEMEEEPVYVNAKQYHGILRRRQMRARAELDKRLVKNRKPYLHESRHQHAMRRARGSGGRFLNTKKLDGTGTNSTSGEQSKSGEITSTQSSSSASAHLSYNGNNISNQQDDGASIIHETHKKQNLPNGFSNSNGLASYYMESTRRDPGNGHFSDDNWTSLVSQPPQGPSSSK